MRKPELPDQFLYSRKGPWPQPSPSHPMRCADEVLNIPPLEELLFNSTIGARYMQAQIGYPPQAAAYAAAHLDWTGPTDDRFNEIMLDTLYTRFLRQFNKEDQHRCGDRMDLNSHPKWWVYDFTAMQLVDPLEGTYCAATRLYIGEDSDGSRRCRTIEVNNETDVVWIEPGDEAWDLAKLYVLQGAAYNALFVVHPALHFPMDAVNAITKSSVPIAHPLYQLLFPHSSYSLALDHAVLESAESVVSNNAQGTRFDPLTADAYNLKLLFGAGYTGLPKNEYGDAYPSYHYMEPAMGFDSTYGRWLKAYFDHAFMPFCTKVADYMGAPERNLSEYVRRWALYNHTHVLGFPDSKEILDRGVLGKAMAIFMWDTTVSHGGDHASFAYQISPLEKCLRIRRPPPKGKDDPRVKPGEIFRGDDLARAALAQHMFFQPWAIHPNLIETYYAFTDPGLQGATAEFHKSLMAVSTDQGLCHFMPLTEDQTLSESLPLAPGQDRKVGFDGTIPQSVQY